MTDAERIKEMVYNAVFAILDDEEGITGLEAGAMATACESIVAGFLNDDMTVRTPMMKATIEALDDLPGILGLEDTP